MKPVQSSMPRASGRRIQELNGSMWRPIPLLVVAATAAAVVLVSACGAGGSPATRVERTDSAGIEIVRNIGSDVVLDWRLERRLSLGGADSGPESFYSIGPTTMGVDSAGDVYVLSDHRIVVFDSAGRHLRSFGGQGSGPGEFEDTGGMIVRPDGSVAVYDYGKAAFVRYAPDGTPLEDRRIEVLFTGGELAVTALGPALSLRRVDHERLLVLGRGKPTEIAAVHWTPPEREPVQFPNCPIRVNFPHLYVPNLLWAARGETIVVSAGKNYELDLYRPDGRRLASLRRSAEPIPATIQRAAREEAARWGVDSWRIRAGRTQCDVPWEDYVEARGIEEWIPVIRKLAIAPNGQIWVDRRLAEGGTRTDVLAPGGEYLGTLPPGTPFPAAFMPDGDPIVIEADEFDVERLVVYDVNRSGTA